jgi:hypothetical protein
MLIAGEIRVNPIIATPSPGQLTHFSRPRRLW